MKIMVPVDSSPYSKRGVEIAGQYVQKFPSEIFLVNVQPVQVSAFTQWMPKGAATTFVPNQDLEKEADAILDEAEKIISVYQADKIARTMLSGHVADEIVKFAESEKIDLIIIGSHGLSGIKRFLMGSVANAVVSHAHCSVLVVRSTKE
jgi:nucleotide-binding universal stress UspA family protein